MPSGNKKAKQLESLRTSKPNCEVYNSLSEVKLSKKAQAYASKQVN